jgi:hypothetical protein
VGAPDPSAERGVRAPEPSAERGVGIPLQQLPPPPMPSDDFVMPPESSPQMSSLHAGREEGTVAVARPHSSSFSALVCRNTKPML